MMVISFFGRQLIPLDSWYGICSCYIQIHVYHNANGCFNILLRSNITAMSLIIVTIQQ